MSVFKAIGAFLSAPFEGGANVISTLLGMGNDYLNAKRTEKSQQQQHNNAMALNRQTHIQERALSGDDHAAKLDEMSVAQRGWKDDYLLIITSIPLLVTFGEPLLLALFAEEYIAGSAAKAIEDGFSALSKAPEYYWYALGLIYVDTFGFRRMVRIAIEHFIKRKFGMLTP